MHLKLRASPVKFHDCETFAQAAYQLIFRGSSIKRECDFSSGRRERVRFGRCIYHNHDRVTHMLYIKKKKKKLLSRERELGCFGESLASSNAYFPTPNTRPPDSRQFLVRTARQTRLTKVDFEERRK